MSDPWSSATVNHELQFVYSDNDTKSSTTYNFTSNSTIHVYDKDQNLLIFIMFMTFVHLKDPNDLQLNTYVFKNDLNDDIVKITHNTIQQTAKMYTFKTTDPNKPILVTDDYDFAFNKLVVPVMMSPHKRQKLSN